MRSNDNSAPIRMWVKHPLTLAVLMVTTACTGQAVTTTTSDIPTTGTQPVTTTSDPGTSRAAPDRIGIRTVEGTAEFFHQGSGLRFTPIGVNYVDFNQLDDGSWADSALATNLYDRDRVIEAFSTISSLGYNTVRLFFDTCGTGRHCIGSPDGPGMNPGYLDNLADLMWIAADHGIYLMLTANDIPDGGHYWPLFDEIFSRGHEGFEAAPNADWLHQAGVETKKQIWRDLLSGLAERSAPFETVLGWQLTNEFWLHVHHPPMSLSQGMVETANGGRYDMADPEEKRRMVADGVVYFIDEVRQIIAEHDPDGLVTMGFFAPYFETENWYVDTPSIIHRANLDFWDFHAYYDAELSIEEQVESFGIVGYRAKPVVMGEMGGGKATLPSAASSLSKGLEWMAQSCAHGFDGWLNWGYYPWPENIPGPPWAFLDDGGVILEGMAPNIIGDPCNPSPPPVVNAAFRRHTTASNSLAGEPSINATDGSGRPWNSGRDAPQWIEIALDGPTSVASVGMITEQWPSGDTHHRVWFILADGSRILAGDIARFTTLDQRLGFDLAEPIGNVVAVRIETLSSPAWVAWREIDVVTGEEGQACAGLANQTVSLFGRPGEPARGTLPVGTRVLIDGRMDGLLRVPGDGWVEESSIEVDCPALPTVDGPILDLVPVTFKVVLPPGTTGEVFIGGYFPGSGLAPWVPYLILLRPEQGLVRSQTVGLLRGSAVRYAYTLGDWGRVEVSDSCADVPPRTFTVVDGQVSNDVVPRWADDC